jgi:hypothetical protein
MLPEKHIWVFSGEGGRFPGGVFTSRELADAWIRARKLTGVLTAYPLDEGCIDWALREQLVSSSVLARCQEPAFAGSFTSASQEHVHYEDGVAASGC